MLLMRLYGLCLILVYSIGCQSTRLILPKADSRELRHLLHRKGLLFKAEVAEPTARQTLVALPDGDLQQFGSQNGFVDLRGDQYFITLTDDRVTAVLPYYSQKQFFENYTGGRDFIELDLPVSELEYYCSPSQRLADIRFHVQDQTEPFLINIRLSGNQQAIVTVMSPHRDRIQYYGEIGELPGIKGRVGL